MSEVKMVIVVRKDLKMGKGKIAAQVSHACMKVFFDKLKTGKNDSFELPVLPYFKEYIQGSFKKVVVHVASEKELLDIYQTALKKKIYTSLIIDSGKTEFHGVPTKTCCCIGPWNEKEINEITGNLPLL